MNSRLIYALLGAIWLIAFVFFIQFAQTHVFLLADVDNSDAHLGNVASTTTTTTTTSSVSLDELAWKGTIFVNMAAYRDKLCHKTVWEAIGKASNPARLHFGIFQQHNESADPDCLLFAGLCEQLGDASRVWSPDGNPYGATRSQIELACSVLPRIQISRIDYLGAQGPTVGRFRAQEFMGAQDFYLQIDTHSLFVGGWDVELIVTWQLADDANAVLTTYPRDAHHMTDWQQLMPPARTPAVAPSYTVERVSVVRDTRAYPYDPNLLYFPPTVPVVCNGQFLARDMGAMAKFNAHTMLSNTRRPVMAPYFAAGFAFMPARAVRQCRYDPHTPMLFDGEELSYAVRLFTHGFNLYAPPTDTVFHKYETGENPKYWQVDWNTRYFVQMQSARRIAAVLSGTPPPAGAAVDYSVAEFERFGLGTARTVQEYIAYSGVDIPSHTFRSVCNEISAGTFGAHIRRAPLNAALFFNQANL